MKRGEIVLGSESIPPAAKRVAKQLVLYLNDKLPEPDTIIGLSDGLISVGPGRSLSDDEIDANNVGRWIKYNKLTMPVANFVSAVLFSSLDPTVSHSISRWNRNAT